MRSKDDCSAKPFVHNNLLQILTVLHYFGELSAIGMRQFIVGETVDSILVKEDRVEIIFLFHSIYFNIAVLLLSTHHDSIHIRYI